MILRPRPSAFGLLFTLRGSVVPRIAPRVLTVLLISAAVTLIHRHHPFMPELTPAPFTLLGLALSIFLGFRNNACYDRWWEARKHWGQLVVEARCLTRDVLSLLPADAALRHRLAYRTIAFTNALRCRLRDAPDIDTERWLSAAEWQAVLTLRNRPDAILRAQSRELAALRPYTLTDITYQLLDARVTAMCGIQTACERIRSTPTPFAYTLLLHRTAWLFCLLLPFGLVGSMGLATPVLSAIMAYAFFGLDALGDELEEPFGASQNNLPLDAMARLIETDIREALGDMDLREPVEPVNFVLS